ncbi:unnamed protein product [Lampetra fluviatilis]
METDDITFVTEEVESGYHGYAETPGGVDVGGALPAGASPSPSGAGGEGEGGEEVHRKRRPRGHGDPDRKGKRPRPAYLHYYTEAHARVRRLHPELPRSEINRRVSEGWRRLAVGERDVYLQRAHAERARASTPATAGGALSVSAAPSPEPPTTSPLPGFRRILPRSVYLVIPAAAGGGKGGLARGPRGQREGRCHEQTDVRQDGQMGIHTDGQIARWTDEQTDVRQDGQMGIHTDGQIARWTDEQTDAQSDRWTDRLTNECSSSDIIISAIGSISSSSSSNIINNIVMNSVIGSIIIVIISIIRSIIIIIASIISTLGSTVSCESQRERGHYEPHETDTLTQGPNSGGKDRRAWAVPAAAHHRVEKFRSARRVVLKANVDAASRPQATGKSTYTRRGRGSCPGAGCCFGYVTRHKPPVCPHCGTWLGGKWVPRAGARRAPAAAVAAAAATLGGAGGGGGKGGAELAVAKRLCLGSLPVTAVFDVSMQLHGAEASSGSGGEPLTGPPTPAGSAEHNQAAAAGLMVATVTGAEGAALHQGPPASPPPDGMMNGKDPGAPASHPPILLAAVHAGKGSAEVARVPPVLPSGPRVSPAGGGRVALRPIAKEPSARNHRRHFSASSPRPVQLIAGTPPVRGMFDNFAIQLPLGASVPGPTRVSPRPLRAILPAVATSVPAATAAPVPTATPGPAATSSSSTSSAPSTAPSAPSAGVTFVQFIAVPGPRCSAEGGVLVGGGGGGGGGGGRPGETPPTAGAGGSAPLAATLLSLPQQQQQQQQVAAALAAQPTPPQAGLKASTLKQLGQAGGTGGEGAQVEEGDFGTLVQAHHRLHHPFELGLATSRGKGRCKSPGCGFVYMNRHKPLACPKCGAALRSQSRRALRSQIAAGGDSDDSREHENREEHGALNDDVIIDDVDEVNNDLNIDDVDKVNDDLNIDDVDEVNDDVIIDDVDEVNDDVKIDDVDKVNDDVIIDDVDEVNDDVNIDDVDEVNDDVNIDDEGHVFALEVSGGQEWYVATDHVGTPLALFDGKGALAKTLHHTAFGEPYLDSAPHVPLPLGFRGGLWDPLCRLVHLAGRDYDPLAGRWAGPDPGLWAGLARRPVPFNPYMFQRNNPVGSGGGGGGDGGAGYMTDVSSWLQTFGFQLHNVIPGFPRPREESPAGPRYELQATLLAEDTIDGAMDCELSRQLRAFTTLDIASFPRRISANELADRFEPPVAPAPPRPRPPSPSSPCGSASRRPNFAVPGPSLFGRNVQVAVGADGKISARAAAAFGGVGVGGASPASIGERKVATLLHNAVLLAGAHRTHAANGTVVLHLVKAGAPDADLAALGLAGGGGDGQQGMLGLSGGGRQGGGTGGAGGEEEGSLGSNLERQQQQQQRQPGMWSRQLVLEDMSTGGTDGQVVLRAQQWLTARGGAGAGGSPSAPARPAPSRRITEVELSGGRLSLRVRYGTGVAEERARLAEEARQRGAEAAWALEQQRAREGLPGGAPWSDGERRQLAAGGRVPGYQLVPLLPLDQYPELADSPRSYRFVRQSGDATGR